MPRAQFASFQNDDHLAPISEEVLRALWPDPCQHDGVQRAFHGLEFAPGKIPIPVVTIAHRDAAEAGRAFHRAANRWL